MATGKPAASTITTALVYTRVSSDEQAREGISLDTQLAECRSYAVKRGWVLGREYQDVMKGTRDDRPSYQEMLADIRQLVAEAQRIAVVTIFLDRLGRTLLERVRSREELGALDVAVHSVREGGEVSDLVANILASVAQEEVRRLGERVSAVRQHLTEQGWFAVGRPAWGYRLRPATEAERKQGAPKSVLELDDETAPYVRELFERVASGMSVRQAALWVRALPSGPRGGRVLTYAKVAAALRNPTYVARPKQGEADVLARPRTNWSPIVDDETWQRVQAFISGHQYHPHQGRRGLLVGFLRCSKCGSRMYTNATPQRPLRYRCSAHMRGANVPHCDYMAPAHLVEQRLLYQIERVVRVAASLPAVQTSLRRWWEILQAPERDDKTERRRAQLEGQAQLSKQRLTRAAVIYTDGDIDREGYDLACGQARADLDAATAELSRLDDARPMIVLPPLETALQVVGGWPELLGHDDTAARRDVLAHLIESAVAHRVGHGRYEVEIAWTPLGEALVRLMVLSEIPDVVLVA